MSEPVPFTQYVPCPSCNGSGITLCEMCKGKGWKRERNGYRMIPCPICHGNKKTVCLTCRGKKKLPEWDTDGRWMKKIVSGLTKSNQEVMA